MLTEPLLTVAREYAIERALVSREPTSAGAAAGTPSFYGDRLMDTPLDLLQSRPKQSVLEHSFSRRDRLLILTDERDDPFIAGSSTHSRMPS